MRSTAALSDAAVIWRDVVVQKKYLNDQSCFETHRQRPEKVRCRVKRLLSGS